MKIKIEIEIDTIEDHDELEDIVTFIKTKFHDPANSEVMSPKIKQTFHDSTGRK